MIVGLMGLGEVGTQYGIGMVQNGATVKGYDIRFNNPSDMGLFERCTVGGITLVHDAQELIAGCDIIMANTSSHVALDTAKMAKPYLKPEQIYIDGNSAIPTVKHEIETLLKDTCHFVDGCTMNSPTQLGVKCPVVVSGPLGQKTADMLNSVGMNITCVGEHIGQASALKCIRSIFTKSLISALMESMLIGYRYEITAPLFESIVQYLKDPPENTLGTIIKTNVLHAKRQAEEIDSISQMEFNEGMDNTMAAAAAKKLYLLASLDMRKKFNDRVAPNINVVLEEYTKALSS